MAITFTNRGIGSNTNNSSPYAATVLAPTANRVQLAFVVSSVGSSGPPGQPTLASTGLTWQAIATVNFGTQATPLKKLTAFCAQGAAPSGTIVTITVPNGPNGGTPTGCAWSFIELNGVDTTGISGINAIADSAIMNINGVTSISTLDLGGVVFTGDAVIAGLANTQNTTAFTPQESWVETGPDVGYSTPTVRISTQFVTTYDATPTATWTPTTADAAGIALEIKAIENAFKANPKPGDTITVTDAPPLINLITGATKIQFPSETVTVSDTPTVQIWQREWYGTVNLIDEPQQIDLMTISDAPPLVIVSGLPQPNVNDLVTLTDTPLVAGLAVVVPVADLLTVGDNQPILTVGGGIFVNDTVSITDTLTPNLLNQPQRGESLTLTDTPTVSLVSEPHADDVATLTDTPTVRLFHAPLAADSLTLTDTPTITGLIIVVPADNLVTVTDSAQAILAGIIPVDNFDDNTQSTGFWAVAASSASTDALVLVNETANQLRITPRPNAGAVDAFNGYRAAYPSNYTDTGAFAEVPQVANSASTARTSLHLSIDTTNGYDITQEGGQLYFEYSIANVITEQHIPYSASQHRWWRIRHVSAGDTIRYETSPTGTTGSWTERLNIPRPVSLSVTALRLGLESGTYASVASPGVAFFDNVNATTLTAFPADAITLTDTLTLKGLIPKILRTELINLTEDTTIGFGGTLLPDEGDSVAVSDFAEAEIIELTSDTVTVTDTFTVNLLAMPRSADLVTLSDAVLFPGVLLINRQDSVTVSESPPLVTLSGMRFSDTVTVTDTAQAELWMDNIWGGTVNLLEMPHSADSVTVSESPPLINIGGINGFDLVTLTDSATVRGLILLIPTADVVTLSDTVLFTSMRLINVTDSVTLTDTTTLKVPILKPITDDIVFLGDDRLVTFGGTLVKLVGDQITLGDFAEAEGILLIDDLVSVVDTFTVNLLEMPRSADTVTLSDTPALQLVHQPHPAELLTLTDIVTVKGLVLPIATSDSMTLTDQVVVTGLTLPVFGADSVTLSDAVLFPGVRLISAGDSVTLTDTPTVTGLILRTITNDSVTLTDQLTGNLVDTVFAADTITSTDTIFTRLFLSPQPADSVTLTDVVTLKGLTLLISRVDTITLTDSATFGGVITRADTLSLSDQSTVWLFITPRVTESLTVIDTPSVWAGFRSSDRVTVSDSVTIFTIGGIVTQPTVVVEGEVRDLTKVAEVSLAAVTATLRDLTKVSETRMTSVTAAVRDLTKTVEFSMAQVVADVRDLSKVA